MSCFDENRKQKDELDRQHKEAEEHLKASTSSHEYHMGEQKKLDDELNQLYVNSADKIEHLNKKLQECNTNNNDLDHKLREAQLSKDNVPPPTTSYHQNIIYN